MSAKRTFGKSLQFLAIGLLLLGYLADSAISAEKTYSPKNADEVEVISLALASEVKANNWTKRDLICVSVEHKDPDKKLLKTLKQYGLNVCKASDWQRDFSCGFHIDMHLSNIDASQTSRLHATTVDLREINNGDAHIAVTLREGDYSFRKNDGKWTVTDYSPSK